MAKKNAKYFFGTFDLFHFDSTIIETMYNVLISISLLHQADLLQSRFFAVRTDFVDTTVFVQCSKHS